MESGPKSRRHCESMSLRRVKLKSTPRGLRRHRRVRRWPSLVIGLTGSIAMGKSTAAAFFKHLRIPVFDADAAVHLLMGPRGKATQQIAARFPDVVGPQGVDRKALGGKVFADKSALKDLEKNRSPAGAPRPGKFPEASRTPPCAHGGLGYSSAVRRQGRAHV